MARGVGDEYRSDFSLHGKNDAPRSNAAPIGPLVPASERLGIAATGLALHLQKDRLDPLPVASRYPFKRALGSAT
jgi:hypothetical protein